MAEPAIADAPLAVPQDIALEPSSVGTNGEFKTATAIPPAQLAVIVPGVTSVPCTAATEVDLLVQNPEQALSNYQALSPDKQQEQQAKLAQAKSAKVAEKEEILEAKRAAETELTSAEARKAAAETTREEGIRERARGEERKAQAEERRAGLHAKRAAARTEVDAIEEEKETATELMLSPEEKKAAEAAADPAAVKKMGEEMQKMGTVMGFPIGAMGAAIAEKAPEIAAENTQKLEQHEAAADTIAVLEEKQVIAEKKVELAELEIKAAEPEIEEEIRQATAQIAAADLKIKSAEEIIAATTTQINELRTQIAGYDSQIATLDREIASIDSVLKSFTEHDAAVLAEKRREAADEEQLTPQKAQQLKNDPMGIQNDLETLLLQYERDGGGLGFRDKAVLLERLVAGMVSPTAIEGLKLDPELSTEYRAVIDHHLQQPHSASTLLAALKQSGVAEMTIAAEQGMGANSAAVAKAVDQAIELLTGLRST